MQSRHQIYISINSASREHHQSKLSKQRFKTRQQRSFFLGLRMLLRRVAAAVTVLLFIASVVEGKPQRIVVDTDVDTDDLFALLYLLKLNTSQFQLEVYIS
ncbi:transmembrane protein, putative [Medicago truncatula]|uniref:Transmembrane protein, putative n=1 Tax=Medicago truncatula TaxID=3880 RepID=A0A072UJ03_MEDTR|nr:transmembrane protein, putative [Medicago truncatula]